MDNNQKIEGNLYGFYNTVARAAGIEYIQEEYYSWVRNPNGLWPNYVFNIDLDVLTRKEYINKLANRMIRKEIPSIIVNRLPENAESWYDVAGRNGLREIYGWTGMALDRTGINFRSGQDTDLSINNPFDSDQLTHWMEIVNSSLFNSKSLSLEMITVMSGISGMKMYTGSVSDVPVCTALSFLQDEVAGLYMISTLPEHRGKGYGTRVTVSAIENCFDSGARTIILHASGMGENIYRRLGFKEYCKFGILWMVGKEFT